MTITELSVGNEEQTIFLSNGYTAVLRFDMIYKRWFYDLYRDGEIVFAGIALVPDSRPLYNMSEVSLGLVDFSDDKKEYEPYSELGARLGLMEIVA